MKNCVTVWLFVCLFIVVMVSVVLCRYALDVNVERAEDVLTHKRLLQLAEDPANQPAFEVRTVQVTTHAVIGYYDLLLLSLMNTICVRVYQYACCMYF